MAKGDGPKPGWTGGPPGPNAAGAGVRRGFGGPSGEDGPSEDADLASESIEKLDFFGVSAGLGGPPCFSWL